MRVVELALVRRLLPLPEWGLAAARYAYQGARSPEILPADRDAFVTERRRDDWATYVAGVAIAGAFYSTSLKLIDTLRRCGALQVFADFCGHGVTIKGY